MNDPENDRYVGFYANDKPLPPDNDYHLTLDEYLMVLEGQITIKILPDGPSATYREGDMAYLPGDTHINLTLDRLPYKESFVMIPTEEA